MITYIKHTVTKIIIRYVKAKISGSVSWVELTQLWTVNYLEATYIDFMSSLKTQVGSAPHQPEEWNRMLRRALTLHRIYTFTQVHSLCQRWDPVAQAIPTCLCKPTRGPGLHNIPVPQRKGTLCVTGGNMSSGEAVGKGRCVQTLISCRWLSEVSLEMLVEGVSPGQPRGSILISRKSQLGSARSSANKHKWTRCCLFYPLKKKGNSLPPQGQTPGPQAHEFQLCGFQWPEIQVLRDTMWLFWTYVLHLTTKICF